MEKEKDIRAHKFLKGRNIVFSCLIILLLVVGVIGFSYAAFEWTSLDNKENTISTGTIAMSYTKGTNGINIVDAWPMDDKAGMALEDSVDGLNNNTFKFVVSSTIMGNAIIDYEIGIHKNGSSTLNDKDVHLYLTEVIGSTEVAIIPSVSANKDGVFTFKANENMPNSLVPVQDMTIVKGSYNVTASKTYMFRMWLSKDYKSNNTKETYSLTINAYAKAK